MAGVAQRLRAKYKRARTIAKEHTKVFDEIDKTLDNIHRTQWLEQERIALRNRVDDPTAMDIYDVKLAKGMHACILSMM